MRKFYHHLKAICSGMGETDVRAVLEKSRLQYRLEAYAHRPRVSRGGRVGSARGLPVRPPWEEQTKHETKPRRNLGNRAFFNNHVFVLLISFVFVNIAVYCLVLDHNTQEIVIGNL